MTMHWAKWKGIHRKSINILSKLYNEENNKQLRAFYRSHNKMDGIGFGAYEHLVFCMHVCDEMTVKE